MPVCISEANLSHCKRSKSLIGSSYASAMCLNENKASHLNFLKTIFYWFLQFRLRIKIISINKQLSFAISLILNFPEIHQRSNINPVLLLFKLISDLRWRTISGYQLYDSFSKSSKLMNTFWSLQWIGHLKDIFCLMCFLQSNFIWKFWAKTMYLIFFRSAYIHK